MALKKLFLHCGGSKAGSSAIQNFLELRGSALAQLGFAYRNPVGISFEHQIHSGNGAELAYLLTTAQPQEVDLDACLLRLVGDEPNAICSSEYFSDLDTNAWNRLHIATGKIGFQLRPIFFVRNVIPFLGSLYDQAIKRHGEWRPFDVWCQEGVWQHPRALRALYRSTVSDAVEVLHYDLVADCVVEHFLRVIGLDRIFSLEEEDKQRRVNRSLRASEREALRLINETIGGEYSAELSDMLLRAKPHSQVEPEAVSESIVQLLRDRYQADVDWVNETWFDGQSVVSFQPRVPASAANGMALPTSSGALTLGRIEAADVLCRGTSLREDLEHDLVYWCIKKMQQSLDKSIERVCAQLRNIDWEHSLDPAIPKTFDPVAYLLLNPDVLKNRAKPFQHFLEYGQHEPGRLWEWRYL